MSKNASTIVIAGAARTPVGAFNGGLASLPAHELGSVAIKAALERARVEVEQWLYWQMANLGPNCGQAHHFRNYAQEKIAYAIDRYTNEVNRLYGVMNARLKDREFLAGTYSVADMASYPWVRPYKNQGQDLADFPNLEKWYQRMHDRPAVAKAVKVGEELRANYNLATDKEAQKVLFGQRARR